MNVQITPVVHGASSAGRNSTAVRALRVTINEVAAHADVSRQTVSNTLNHSDRVRPATLQRVRESIDLLGYRPSAPSQQLRRQRSGAVGFELNALGSALNEVAHPFLVALSVATAQYGCHLVPFASGDARPALDGYIDTVQRHLVDAFVIVDTHPMDPRPAWLSQRAIPWVAFGRVWDDETLTNWADVDGRAGTAAAVDHLVERGLPTVLSQTFRALIHSRLEQSITSYATSFPDAKLIVLEPSKGDADLFFSNLFSYGSRRRLAEHAYQHTRAQLLARADVLATEFALYGIKLNLRALEDPSRKLLPTARRFSRGETGAVASKLAQALDELEVALLR